MKSAKPKPLEPNHSAHHDAKPEQMAKGFENRRAAYVGVREHRKRRSPSQMPGIVSHDGRNLALYIHWPFCRSKCPYCDFNSHVRDAVDQTAWRTALLAELEYTAAQIGPRTLTSIFFGGGTPSLMPPATAGALIDRAAALFTPAPDLEITLEANPTSVEAETFSTFRAAGINRASLGVQSLNDESLQFLGRHHSAAEALRAVSLAAETFDRYSFDLIYALPGQTPAMWESELKAALTHARDHLSLYQLTIEPGTQFFHRHAKGEFTMPSDDTQAHLFALTQSIMESAGMPAYEISNHAAPGAASRHNLAYWQGLDYAGIGPGAHGRLTLSTKLSTTRHGAQGTRHATVNLRSPEAWLAHIQAHGHGTESSTPLTPGEQAEERILMGLRLREGIDIHAFESATGLTLRDHINRDALTRLTTADMITHDEKALRATAQGFPLLSQLTASLLS